MLLSRVFWVLQSGGLSTLFGFWYFLIPFLSIDGFGYFFRFPPINVPPSLRLTQAKLLSKTKRSIVLSKGDFHCDKCRFVSCSLSQASSHKPGTLASCKQHKTLWPNCWARLPPSVHEPRSILPNLLNRPPWSVPPTRLFDIPLGQPESSASDNITRAHSLYSTLAQYARHWGSLSDKKEIF